MKKILVCIPTISNEVHHHIYRMLEGFARHKKNNYDFDVEYIVRKPHAYARNHAINSMLKGNYDGLIMIDDDNPIVEDAIEKFIRHDKDIVVGAIPSRKPVDKEGRHIVAIVDEYVDNFGIKRTKGRYTIPRGGELIEVDNAGTGAVYLSREVCAHMRNKYGKFPFYNEVEHYIVENNTTTPVSLPLSDEIIQKIVDGNAKHLYQDRIEDQTFFKRAREQGFNIYCDTSIRGYHLTENGIVGMEAKNMFTGPVTSVVICAYNNCEYTKKCVESAREAMIDPFEIIVIDDGSTDETEQVFSAMKDIRYIKNDKNMGVTYTRNKGVQEARGDFVMVCNNDILFYQGIDRDLSQMLNEKTLIACPHQFLGLKEWAGEATRPKNNITGSCWMVRKDSRYKIGPIDERIHIRYNDNFLQKKTLSQGYQIAFSKNAIHHYESRTVGYSKEENPQVREKIKLNDGPARAQIVLENGWTYLPFNIVDGKSINNY